MRSTGLYVLELCLTVVGMTGTLGCCIILEFGSVLSSDSQILGCSIKLGVLHEPYWNIEA